MKKTAITDFNGYEWGYLKSDGKREDQGTGTVIKMTDVIGVWGRYFRKGMARPYYRETLISELPGIPKAPMAAVQSLNFQQCIAFAYPESNPISADIMVYSVPKKVKTVTTQLWECECGHTFYTDLGKRTVKQFLQGLYKYAKCSACGEFKAVRKSKIVKEV